MKRRYLSFIAPLFILMIGFVAPPSGQADFVLNASCSSQIAEAFQRELLERFMAESGVKVSLHVFPSEVCLDRLRNGFSNMAASTIPISQSDREIGMIEIPTCKDPLVVITHAQCKVTNLSLKEVRQIFSGSITNWKEVGGPDLPVIRIIPGYNTGAYQNFKALAMGPFEISDDLIAAKTFTALKGVKNIPGAVSFMAHGIAIQHTDIAVVNLDGVSPGQKDYPFHQTFYMVIKGEANPMMKQVIKYMLSDKAKDKMLERGMIPTL